jgi:hypothetical protein
VVRISGKGLVKIFGTRTPRLLAGEQYRLDCNDDVGRYHREFLLHTAGVGEISDYESGQPGKKSNSIRNVEIASWLEVEQHRREVHVAQLLTQAIKERLPL